MDRRYDPDTTTPDIDADRARVPRGEWLVGAGEMAESIRSLDWSSTPLGPREHWPESLRTVVNLLVASRFPMALLWGRELLHIYNDAYRVVAGGKHPAALGRSTREIWPEVWHVNEPILAAVMDRGETVYLEDACFPINRHGYPEDAYFTLCYAPVRVESGAVGGALVTLEETTARVAERKHAREAVRESTALLQAISDTSADVIFAKDRVGRIRFANPATLAVIGKTAAEVIGKTDAEFLGDSAAARAVMENDRRIMERGVSEDVEERVPLPDGTHRIWFSRKSPLRDATGEVVGLVGISRDITDRKRAEEAVRAGEERYRNLFTNMTEGFAVGEPILDDAGVLHDVRLLEMNAAFERHTGLDIARTRGRPLREVLPEIEPEWIEAYGAVALSGKPVRFENYNRALDRHFDVYCYRPAPGQFAIVFTDVTAKKRAEEASTREHELLTRLVERLPVMITMYHPRLGGFRFNDEFQRVLGWTEEDAASGDLMARAYPDPKVREEAAEHMTSVAPGWRELPVVAKDGTVVPSTWANLRLSDDTQVGIGIDLRDRKRREQEIKDALARAEQHGALLAAMMDHIPMGITIADAPDVNIRAVSRYGRELLDKSSAELTNIPAEQHPDAWAVFRADGVTRASAEELPLTRATVNGEVISGEEWVVARRDGTRIPILCTAAPIRDGRGSITGGVIGWQDLTERKRAEERLRGALEAAEAERRRLEAVLEALPAGVALADATGRITLFNDALTRIWGGPPVPRSADEYREWRGWWPATGKRLEAHDWAMARAIETGEVVSPGDVVEIDRFDGSGRATIINSAAPILDSEGRIMGGVLAEVDITAQRHAEDALRAANEKLRDADRRKDEFLGMLSHELRNPLAPIRNALYILDRAEPNGQQARRAREIANRQLAHLTRLVDDLLDVTRIARGKIELRRVELDLAALARRTAEDHRQLMQDRHVDLALELPDTPVLLDGDETRLAQAIGNLLHNAAKFTPGGGRVTLSVNADRADAVLRVRDTGAGIEPEMIEAIFEPFTQAKQTLARSEGGLGLGLALVKGLVALHGGDVTVSSEGPGRGTEFAIRLPLATAHRERAIEARDGSANPLAGRLRVLIIDDNHDAADSLAQLVSMMGHDAEVAYDAFDGLARVASAVPDLVLCDIGLPGMDGYEFARQFRAASGCRSVRLVAVSGYAQPEDVARAVDAGFDAHVAKPPDPEKIAGLLGELA